MRNAASARPARTRRRLCCGLALLLAVPVLSACSKNVTGSPHDAAGFGPSPSTPSPSTPSPSTPSPSTPSPSTPSPFTSSPFTQPPRRLDGLDTCTLLAPADLDRVGGAESVPRRDELLPQSCAYPLVGAAPGDVAAVAFYKPLEQARAQAPDGTLVHTAGHPTWLVCGVDDGYQSCSAAVAVRPDRTLLVLLSRRDVSEPSVRGDLEQLTRTALSRLPAS